MHPRKHIHTHAHIHLHAYRPIYHLCIHVHTHTRTLFGGSGLFVHNERRREVVDAVFPQSPKGVATKATSVAGVPGSTLCSSAGAQCALCEVSGGCSVLPVTWPTAWWDDDVRLRLCGGKEGADNGDLLERASPGIPVASSTPSCAWVKDALSVEQLWGGVVLEISSALTGAISVPFDVELSIASTALSTGILNVDSMF